MCSLNRMPGAGLGHDGCERSLADLEQIAPQVVAIEFDEVESIEEDALVSAVVTNEIERGNAVVIAGDSFAIDDARCLYDALIEGQKKAPLTRG
jgi:hypothetical protein